MGPVLISEDGNGVYSLEFLGFRVRFESATFVWGSVVIVT